MSEVQNIRALLVEDDDEDADIFGRYAAEMTEYAVTLVRAAGEEEAKRCLAGERFDLIFLDLSLGRGRNGLDLLKELHKHQGDVPVIVVTGKGDELKAVRAMKSGAYDYLVKDLLTADLLELAIQNAQRRQRREQELARMVEKLAELSVTDELTSVANRRHLTQKLEEEVARSSRTGHLFALLMIDLDHFKEVNDKHGHQTGDEVLKQCAAALQQTARATDFVGRYGGEEFCVVLPETAPSGARRVAEKLREAVKALPDPVPTISVGVAFWEPRSSVADLLRRADAALYKAKEAGRDRVEVYSDRDGDDQ